MNEEMSENSWKHFIWAVRILNGIKTKWNDREYTHVRLM